MFNLMRRCAFAAAILSLTLAARAEVKLPSVFSDHMVLQRDRTIPVWGWAGAGEKVTVALHEQTAEATAGADGKWMARLKAEKAGGPLEMTVTGSSTVKFTDVLVGEVWVCSGQSNMQWTVKDSNGAEDAIKNSDNPQIRLLYVPREMATEPQTDIKAKWTGCNPETVAPFSAVAYFFGRELQAELKIPIGLIHTSWGGTPAEAWTRREKIVADPMFKPIADRWDDAMKAYPAQKAAYDEAAAKWNAEAEKAKADGKPEPAGKPAAPGNPEAPHRPGVLNNAMIAPLVPYAIRGAIWYQGESNAGRAFQYRTLFPGMITDWRDQWGQGDFPFLYVQLANFTERKDLPADSDWAELREAQTMALNLPAVGQAVIIDIGEAKDIHPRNKLDVGKRLAMSAESIAYGKKGPPTSPSYRSVEIDGHEARVKFKYAGKGLEAKGGALKGFAVAGADHVFHWADAKIDGKDTVVVSSSEVPYPVAVRYGWANNPEVTLYGQNGLPASPFRTDDWRGVTADAR